MSKAVEGAATLAGAVGMGALAFVDPMVLALPGYVELATSLAVGGIAMEAGAIADTLMQNRGVGITTRQPAAFRQVIYGTQRVGGVIVYESTTGSHLDQYNYVIVLAGHEVNAIVNLFLDGRQVFWKGSGVGWTVRNGIGFGGNPDSDDHIGPGGQHYNFGTLVYCEARFGDQEADDVISGLTANDPNWAESSAGYPWLGGCTYVYLKIEFDTAMFPNAPEVKFTVQGKNDIWDPRTSTYGYTANWALIAADVITDPQFGLDDPTVNQDQLVAAANVCDELVDLANGDQEARYQTHWHYDCGTAPGDVLQTMMNAAAGRLSRIGGEWYLWPAYWQGPSFTLDESALTGPLQWSGYRSFRELINRVRGTYIAPNSPYNVAGNLYDGNGWYDGTIANQFPFAFQPTNYPQYAQDVLHGYSNDAWLDIDSGSPAAWASGTTYALGDTVSYDGLMYQSLIDSNAGNEPDTSTSDWEVWDGVQLTKEVTQQCVLSVAQAQRCAKIILLRNRYQGSGTMEMTLASWQMQPLDVMQFTFANNSWSDKLLEVVGTGFSIDKGNGDDSAPAVRFRVQVQETDSSIYDWDADTEELSIYDVPANPTQLPYVVTPPSDLALTSDATTAVIGADGVVQPRILATWTAPGDSRVTQIEIQISPHGDDNWATAGLVSAEMTQFYLSGVVAGDEYDVQIASVTAAGAESVWVSGSVTVAAPNSLQGTYTIDPQFPLTQPTATSIAVAASACSFAGLTAVNYAARTLTITTPSAATWYYVYIADPTQQGESGSPTLTATATTSTTDVGVQGYTYLGAILCLPGGSATQILPGGWPAPQAVQVGS